MGTRTTAALQVLFYPVILTISCVLASVLLLACPLYTVVTGKPMSITAALKTNGWG